MTTREEKGVEAVERAFTLLDCFRDDAGPLSLAELARRSGFYKSTILRLMVSLERFGYILRREDGLYRLGPTLWRLGSLYRGSFELSELIRPELSDLVAQTGETASFYVRDGNSRVCLFREEPKRSIRHHIDEGSLLPLTGGASSHVLKAWSQDADGGKPVDGEVLREAGYAFSQGERDPEVAAVAVPVFGAGGLLRGALSVSGLITRFGAAERDRMLACLKASAERLNRHLEAQPGNDGFSR